MIYLREINQNNITLAKGLLKEGFLKLKMVVVTSFQMKTPTISNHNRKDKLWKFN